MKAIFLLITLVFFFSLGVGILAQETELPDPGLTPDSLFYFLETIAEDIGTLFTFGDLKKAERYANLAVERLAEVQAVLEKGKSEFVEKTMERYEMQLQKSIVRAEKAQAKGKSTEKVTKVLTRVGQATAKHLEILVEVYEKVPEQAKPGIENAMKASVKGHERAVEALKARNALGGVPERVSLPNQVPQEVRERVQMKVQQELVIEKVLEVLESIESIRALCTESGGPPEMCEKIPLRGFKSFETLGVFCTESGGPPEICESMEVKCKEFGATTADECFLVLMTATVTTSTQRPSIEEATSEQYFESFTALCIKQGGPPEMCEEIALQHFESFEQIEAYCIEQGGTSEICASLEVQCRESGITTANECFRFLSMSSLKAFSSVTLETSPQPILSEEELEQRKQKEEENGTLKLQTSEGIIEVIGEEGRFIEMRRQEPEGEE